VYSTSDLKRGLIIDFDGAPHVVDSVQVSAPTARNASTISRVRMRNLKTKQKVDKNFRSGETFGVPDIDRRKVQLLYRDNQALHFMDQTSYEQFALDRDDLEWEMHFLVDEMEGIVAFFYNGAAIGVELPNNVTLRITETNPGVKGNSATGRTKPATLETGYEIQVPEHIDQGILVSVDTRTGGFLGRVKE